MGSPSFLLSQLEDNDFLDWWYLRKRARGLGQGRKLVKWPRIWSLYVPFDAFELWCWRRLLRVPWAARRSNQSILKEIRPEYSLEGLMLKLKLILWPPDAKNWLIGKDPDAGKDWGQKKRRSAENEMVRQHHQLNGYEFEQTLGDSGGQRSLEYCSPWGLKESDTT